MASSGSKLPSWEQQRSLQSAASTAMRQVFLHRPRTLRAKIIYLAAFAFFFYILLSARLFNTRPIPDFWSIFPSYHDAAKRPEDSPILRPKNPVIFANGTIPSSLQKENPSFHVLLPATDKSPGLCRALASAMILNYPPPTLVNYRKQLAEGSTPYDYMVDRITSVYNYLNSASHMRDEDFVLITDGVDVFFQLPPEIMIGRFQNLLRENNLKLRKKYGFGAVARGDSDQVDWVQKYSQRVLFGASKACFPNLTHDAGCSSVPESTLPPDVYGWETDTDSDGHLNRPRFLNPGAVIGQVADLKLIYAQMLEIVSRRRNRMGDFLALTQMYGRQEYVRELERRRTTNSFMQWVYRTLGISDEAHMTGITTNLQAGRRYEFGIGVDFESRVFFNMQQSEDDIEWLQYNNISKTSMVQMEHKVPREHRLLLPRDLASGFESPFTLPQYIKDVPLKPPYNGTVDALPDPRQYSWHNFPLMTNIHSGAVPPLIHLNNHKEQSLKDDWWESMWYQPWGRALLRKYIRFPRGRVDAHASSLGGQDWWDMRGGRGGVWTNTGEWIDFSDLCTGFERDLFSDDLGTWGQEDGGEFEKPIYNQWGNKIKGKGPENRDDLKE
ncbi:hypothetical protein ASPZODRAFT_121643 [Penicilliopsis zonata CBS 506.65]|uniref:Uncharacterized protein n=1 Tax=Penicilliopsis zonata CBS 506.65 TaxID=1073090 RepID=A0A1L9SB16_9EURO|nr:hypothetical protein ASPZODRAFT_121643 [Penicilliopsis zonata CBS 506.65]OJJ44348.1 hypothetical protein ASPZODRAFT_121643 [Penicilliopsis zonata CBS 506.65]